MRRNRVHNLTLEPAPTRGKPSHGGGGGGGTVLPGGSVLETEDGKVLETEDGKSIELEQ
jgi:hypothetical protein